MGKIKIKCLKCGDIIEPTRKCPAIECTCGNMFVEGGDDYMHFGGNIKDRNSYLFIKDEEEIRPEDMIIENKQSEKPLLKKKKKRIPKVGWPGGNNIKRNSQIKIYNFNNSYGNITSTSTSTSVKYS